jgi:4'-phosphopantetheinyl transferase
MNSSIPINDFNSIELFYCEAMDSFIETSRFLKYLSKKEAERAEKLIRLEDKRTFIVSHAFLNCRLSRIILVHPSNICFEANEYGKPFIKDNTHFFNLSHSSNSWCIVLFSGCEVGVDIEAIKYNAEYESVIQTYFTKLEQDLVRKMQSPVEMFFRLWTRKEALLKALGTGLNISLGNIDIRKEQIRLKSIKDQIIPSVLFLHSYRINQHYISIAATLPAMVKSVEINYDNINDYLC